MMNRLFPRAFALAIGAVVAIASPALAEGPRGDRGDRSDRGDQNDRGDRNDRSDRGDRGDRGSDRGGFGLQVEVVQAAPFRGPAPVVIQDRQDFGRRGQGRHFNRVQTGMLVVSNPFNFQVRVVVNGQVLGRLAAFDRMQIPNVLAGSAYVTLQNHRQVVASDSVFVQANSRTRWSPRAPRAGRGGGRFASRW